MLLIIIVIADLKQCLFQWKMLRSTSFDNFPSYSATYKLHATSWDRVIFMSSWGAGGILGMSDREDLSLLFLDITENAQSNGILWYLIWLLLLVTTFTTSCVVKQKWLLQCSWNAFLCHLLETFCCFCWLLLISLCGKKKRKHIFNLSTGLVLLFS